MMSAQRLALACVAGEAATSTTGISVAMVMFISARTERMAVTRSMIQPISASVSRSSSARCLGQGASASSPSRAAPACAVTCHSSSVTKRRERMQQLEDLVAHPGGHGARFVLGAAVGALQHRLGQFEIPVAEDVPYEAIGRARGFVELVGLDRLGDLAHGPAGLVRDPAVERFLRRRRVEARHGRAMVDFREAASVPQLGCEIAVAFDPLGGELDVAPLRRHGGEREAQCVGARTRTISSSGSMTLPFDFDILAPRSSRTRAVDIDGVEGRVGHE